MKNTARLIAALVLVAGFAFAQPAAATGASTPADKQPTMGAMKPGMHRMQGMGGQAMPELTAEQQGKMDALRVAHAREVLPIQTDLRVKEVELNALWRVDEPDAKKIIAKVKEIGALREKLEIGRINQRFEMRKILTPEQRKAMGKMGMGRGMRGEERRMHGMRGEGGRGMQGKGQGKGRGQGGNCSGDCEHCQDK